MTTDAMVTTNGTPTLECCLDIVTYQSTVAPKQGRASFWVRDGLSGHDRRTV
jgi:hypothetical protein